MMRNEEYPTVAHALNVCFSVQAENSRAEAISMYRTLLQNGVYSDRLCDELLRAFVYPDYSWKFALYNREYEIDDMETEEEARAHARELLWDGYFDSVVTSVT
jgi:hypothetical protein